MSPTASFSSTHASKDFIPEIRQKQLGNPRDHHQHPTSPPPPPPIHPLHEMQHTSKGNPLKSIKDCNDQNNFRADQFGARHFMLILGTFGIIILVAMRTTLSIAIVAMVGTSSHRQGSNSTLNLNDTCPMLIPFNTTKEYMKRGEFNWDESTQGLVLGAYFYGNIVTNLIGGRVAEYVGGKRVFGVGFFVSALLTLISPAAARLSTKLFVALRFLTGLAQGFVMPAMTRCLVTWIPPMERSKFNTVVFSGAEIGTVTSLAVGGWLCGLDFLGGWPLVFYVPGFLGVIWSILWFLLISERPEDHPRISEGERDYIVTHCKVKRGKPISVPWMAVLTSVPLWSVFIMHIGHNWGYYTFLTLLPSYLNNILHFDLKSNGLLCALPYSTKWFFAIVYAFIMNKLIENKKLNTLSVRKISMILGSFGPALGLVMITVSGCDQMISIIILVVSTTVSGAVFCGYMCSHQDLCPNFASTVFGVSNFLANTTGFIAPATAGTILLNNQTLSAWGTVFYISAAVYVITSLIYAAFVSTEVQPFNSPPTETECEKAEKENFDIKSKC